VNKGTDEEFFQIGRFDRFGTDYNGLFGNSGVDHLDNKSFCFNASPCGKPNPSSALSSVPSSPLHLPRPVPRRVGSPVRVRLLRPVQSQARFQVASPARVRLLRPVQSKAPLQLASPSRANLTRPVLSLAPPSSQPSTNPSSAPNFESIYCAK
jgi:hypothetical protein